MARCRVERGFFVLHDCGADAIGGCSACSRPRCAEHTVGDGSGDGAGALCTDCHARRAESALEPYEQGWAHQHRDAFYRGGYAPLYLGHHHAQYYDTYEVRAFDADLMVDDDGDGSFFDS